MEGLMWHVVKDLQRNQGNGHTNIHLESKTTHLFSTNRWY